MAIKIPIYLTNCLPLRLIITTNLIHKAIQESRLQRQNKIFKRYYISIFVAETIIKRGEHIYYVSDDKIPWNNANTFCQEEDLGRLAIVLNEGENNITYGILQDLRYY